MTTSDSVKLIKSAWMLGKAKDSHNSSVNSLAPIHLSGNPPYNLLQTPSPLSEQRGGQGHLDPSPLSLVSHDGFISQEQDLKGGHTHAQLPIFISKDSTHMRSKKNQGHWAQHPFLGVLSASEDQTPRYLLHEDMNRAFSVSLWETLAALLKHKHNQV